MRKHINQLPCDPGLGCTYPNCTCNVRHVYSSDDHVSNSRVTLKFWLGVLSAGILYAVIFLYVFIFKSEVDNAFTELSSLILTDKALGTTVCIVLFSVVAWNIYRYAKKDNF